MTFIDANEVRALVDKLVGAAYLDGIHELGAASDETLSARSALEQVLSQQTEALADALRAIVARHEARDAMRDSFAPIGTLADVELQAARAALAAHDAAVRDAIDWIVDYVPDNVGGRDFTLANLRRTLGLANEESRSVTNQLLHWGGIPVRVTGTVTTSPGNWPLIDTALMEARNGR